MALEYFQNLNVKRINGEYLPNKPVLLLIALVDCFKKTERLRPYECYEKAISCFESYGENIQVQYPFGRLVNDKIWEVENYDYLDKTTSGDLYRSELIDKKIRGGFTPEIYEKLISKPDLILEISKSLLHQYIPPENHQLVHKALNRLGVIFKSTETLNANDQLSLLELNDNQDQTLTFNIVSNRLASFKTNGYISYLNSLHNLSASGSNALAESQALNPYFGELYEPFPIAKTVRDALITGEEKVIILTGHAGDGKSTVALDVLKALTGYKVTDALSTSLKQLETFNYQGRTISIVKDMSELSIDNRIQWLDDAFGGKGSWLIVSNTGPLLDSLLKFAERGTVPIYHLESQILAKLNVSHNANNLSEHTLPLGEIPKPLVILNMTRLNNVDLGAKVLKRMVEHSGWQECEGCAAETSCALRTNRQTLQNTDVIERVRWVYQRLTAYEQRLTLRQIVAHLAYSLTSGLGCDKAQHYAKHADNDAKFEEGLSRVLFSESFFGYCEGKDNPEARQLHAIKLMHRMEFGRPFAVDFERKLVALNQHWISFPTELNKLVQHWRGKAGEAAGIRWRFILRRMAYLYGQDHQKTLPEFFDHFLQSPSLQRFDRWQALGRFDLSNPELRLLKNTILKVLLEVYSGFSAGQFRDGNRHLYLTLRRTDKAVMQPVQIVLASLEHDNFKLDYDTKQCLPYLIYQPSGERLWLTLPLLDFIQTASLGSLGNQLAPIHLTQLEVFRSKLLKSLNTDADQLTVLRAGIDGEVKTHRFFIDYANKRLDFI